MKQNVKATAWLLTLRKKVFSKPTLATLPTLKGVGSVGYVGQKTKKIGRNKSFFPKQLNKQH